MEPNGFKAKSLQSIFACVYFKYKNTLELLVYDAVAGNKVIPTG